MPGDDLRGLDWGLPECVLGGDPNDLTGLGHYLGYLPAADVPPRLRVGVTVCGSCQGGSGDPSSPIDFRTRGPVRGFGQSPPFFLSLIYSPSSGLSLSLGLPDLGLSCIILYSRNFAFLCPALSLVAADKALARFLPRSSLREVGAPGLV